MPPAWGTRWLAPGPSAQRPPSLAGCLGGVPDDTPRALTMPIVKSSPPSLCLARTIAVSRALGTRLGRPARGVAVRGQLPCHAMPWQRRVFCPSFHASFPRRGLSRAAREIWSMQQHQPAVHATFRADAQALSTKSIRASS